MILHRSLTLVRPYLECFIQFWGFQHKKDTDLLEQGQKNLFKINLVQPLVIRTDLPGTYEIGAKGVLLHFNKSQDGVSEARVLKLYGGFTLISKVTAMAGWVGRSAVGDGEAGVVTRLAMPNQENSSGKKKTAH
ncbi:hypothetical protein WISP_05795 [Willisornis vidua]|uniref:Uncharacterized protein n=1 Tax=Willisornis vidua TaxID=1566151 RepID=A0ABQ9DSW6_9PASS|nr:hypothetical protein WISP_05795 [Willisornis vidua]